jgi:hypothetical protein
MFNAAPLAVSGDRDNQLPWSVLGPPLDFVEHDTNARSELGKGKRLSDHAYAWLQTAIMNHGVTRIAGGVREETFYLIEGECE